MTLTEARNFHNITQAALADLTGIRQSHLSEVESGIHFPTPRTRRKIESIIGPCNWIETRLQGTGDGDRKIVGQILDFLHSKDTMPLMEKIQFLEEILDHAKPRAIDTRIQSLYELQNI